MPELAEFVPINNLRTPCADRNDKLGWTDGFAISLDGISLGIRSNDPEILNDLKDLMPKGGVPWPQRKVDILLSFLKAKESDRKGVRHYHVVYQDWDRVARTFELDDALNIFARSAQLAKLQNSIQKVYFAGDLLDWEGRRLVIAGPLEAREQLKPTLVEHGGRVLIEHVIGLDLNGGLGCAVAPDFKPVSADLILLVEAGARRTLSPLTPAEAALQLLVNAHGASRHPHFVMTVLSAFAPKIESLSLRLPQKDKGLAEWLAKRLKV